MGPGVDVFVRVLGAFEVAGGAVRLPTAQRRLLATLVAHANHPVTVDTLVDALWGDAPPATATASLQSHLSRLRTQLAASGVDGVRIDTTDLGYRLAIPTDQLDALVFEQGVEAARIAARDGDPATALVHQDRALALWRGPAWAGVADDPVLEVDAARLDELQRTVVEERARTLLALGRVEEAAGDLGAFVATHPLREGAVASLVTALYRTGRTADALQALRDHRRHLADELGIDPSPDLERLERDILTRDASLDAAPPVAAGVTIPAPDPVTAAAILSPGDAAVAPAAAPERKLVSVLVVRPGTAGGSAEDPEDQLDAFQPLLDVTVTVVHRHGGVVQTLGPGSVTALFGAPQAIEDHAVRACRAALQVTSEADVPVAVGVRTGEVLLRGVATDLGSALDPVGPALGEAHALATRAAPGEVRICPTTAMLTDGQVHTTPPDADDGDHRLVGLTGASAFEARVARRSTDFVGRQEELGQLAARLADAASGTGQVLAIVGEAGIGKSRLAVEARHTGTDDGWTVLRAAATPYDSALPHQPLTSMLRRLLGPAGTSPDGIRDRLADVGVDPVHAPALVELLSPPTVPSSGVPEDERRRRLHAALVHVVTSRRGPTLLVLEDLQWADRATNEVLAALVDAIVDAPVALLVTYRPEHLPTWTHRSHVTLVRLRPLRDREAQLLLDALLGRDLGLARLRTRLLEWTGGSPLYLEEAVHHLVEQGVLLGPAGDRRLDREVEAITVPDSLRGVVDARVDRLPPGPKALLQLAAVVGEEGPTGLLEDLAAAEEGPTLDDLEPLHTGEFLAPRPQGGDAGFAFRHALIRDAVYGQLPRARRRELHDRAVDAIRHRYGTRANDQTARLAEHAFRAERWQEAAVLLRAAGDHAIERSAHHEAAALWEQAIRALRHLPPSPARDIDEIEIRAALRPALVTHGRIRQALAHLHEAERLARTSEDRRRLGWLLVHTSYSHDLLGTMPPALATAREALALGQDLDDEVLQAEARLALAQAMMFAGDGAAALDALAPAAALFAGSLRLARNGMAGVRGAWAAGVTALSHAQLGHHVDAAQQATAARATADAGGRAVDAAFAHFVQGSVELAAGHTDQAARWLRDGMALAQQEVALAGLWCRARLADTLLQDGHADDALAEATAVCHHAVDNGLVLVEAWARTTRAAALLAGGDVDEGAAEARHAIRVARPNGLTGLASRAAAMAAADGHPTHM